MKYRDLIQFEPVTEVIQLQKADDKGSAAGLISTFVISDRMADVILHRMLPDLLLDQAGGGRGLLIVGNYGTGKSHLMSVITAVAEHADLLEQVKNPIVARGLQSIAGKFLVARQETGATEMHLRNVIFTKLEKQLARMGVDYHFPPMDQTSSNKDLLVEMMDLFTKKHPDKGLLIALDELLDYLRARKDKDLVLDLNFLREVGEACELVPLRFIAGIQEALFDSSRFEFASDSIRRVRARFDQVSIVREDLEYVVSHRLLVKNDSQKQKIRSHLEKFTPLYTAMAENLDKYIELFPVHPAYIEVFEQVTIGERRDLLKALSQQMSELLDQDLPADQPGLIAFDAYWRLMCTDPSYRTIPEVRTVQDKAKILSERVRQSSSMAQYRQAALRIIDGLALHRLTVNDLYAPIGITPVELRDRLCLHLPIPEQDADFLQATIESTLKEITRAVSGQFISHNQENDQYYLDLKKDIDFDALIDQRAASLDQGVIDRYYFDVLARALELTDSSYVPGFRIWQREIPWPGRGITRRGYIFLGAPNERSTAHPERDFYIHFLSLNGSGLQAIQKKPDEVYFILENADDPFKEQLTGYAGAKEMSAISSGSNKDQYERKADQALRQLTGWLRDNLLRAYNVVHNDQSMSAAEAVAKLHLSLREQPFRDQVYAISAGLLAEHFSQKFAGYPTFSGIEFTSDSLLLGADAALRALSGGPVTRPAQAVLEGLKLARFSDGRLHWTVEESPYASHFMELLEALEEGRVLNRVEIVGGEPGAETDVRFKLEPPLVMIVLLSLVRHGILTVNLPGVHITEGGIEDLARMGFDQLWRFTSISRPQPLPERALRELFIQLDIDPELLADARTLDLAVSQLQQKVITELDAAVRMIENLREGPRFWSEMALPPAENEAAKSALENYRQFLNSLQNLNTPARLRNLRLGSAEIRAKFNVRSVTQDITNLFDLLRPLQPTLEYIYQAILLLPQNHPWQKDSDRARAEILAILRNPQERSSPGLAGALKGRLENLKDAYIQLYFDFHKQARLDRQQDERKQRLTSDPRWARLRMLSRLELLPERQLQGLEQRLTAIRTCSGLQVNELRSHPACPHCSFAPVSESMDHSAAQALEELENDFEILCRTWVETLLANLETPEARHNLTLLEARERQAVQDFLQARALPERVTDALFTGIQNTLQGLEKLVIDSSEFLLALTRPGMPCTPNELEARIRDYLQGLLQGKDRRKTRIQIDW